MAPGSAAFPLTIRGVSGAAIVAGNHVYLDNVSQTWFPGLSSGNAKQAGQYGSGIALDSAPGAGQYVTIQQGGQINLGATLTIGVAYVASVNAGAIAPYTDLIAGNFVTILGVAITTSIMQMPPGGPLASGAQH